MNEQTKQPQQPNDEEIPTAIATRQMGEALVPDVQVQTDAGLALLRERARVAEEALKISIGMCSPGQIVLMDGGAGKQSVYFTGGAADRILRMGYGMRWGDAEITLGTSPDGTPTCSARAVLYKADGSAYQAFEGTRRQEGYVKNEQDLVKGAKENMKHQAVTDILGLRFLSPTDLAKLGLDVQKLERRAGFQEHGKDETGEAVVEWGKLKGTKLSALTDKDLDWLMGRAKESLADASKSKFHPSEQRRLNAYEAEKKRRTEPAAAPPSAGDAEELEELLVAIREQAQANGVPETTYEAGISKLNTVAAAKKQLAKLKADAAKTETTGREPGDEG